MVEGKEKETSKKFVLTIKKKKNLQNKTEETFDGCKQLFLCVS